MRLNFSRTENVLVTNIGELELIFRQISRENGAGGNNLAHDLRDLVLWPSAREEDLVHVLVGLEGHRHVKAPICLIKRQ